MRRSSCTTRVPSHALSEVLVRGADDDLLDPGVGRRDGRRAGQGVVRLDSTIGHTTYPGQPAPPPAAGLGPQLGIDPVAGLVAGPQFVAKRLDHVVRGDAHMGGALAQHLEHRADHPCYGATSAPRRCGGTGGRRSGGTARRSRRRGAPSSRPSLSLTGLSRLPPLGHAPERPARTGWRSGHVRRRTRRPPRCTDQPAQEVGPDGVEEVVRLEGQPVEGREPGFGALDLGDGDGSVEGDDRRRVEVDQLVVEGQDLAPVRLRRARPRRCGPR